MTTQTWSFGNSYLGWTHNDINDGGFGCETCVATRSHVSGAIRNNITLPQLPTISTFSNNISPDLFVTVAVNDTIEFDFGAPSDATVTGFDIIVLFDDETTEKTSTTSAIAGTLIHTITSAKTIENITARIRRATAGSPPPIQIFTCDVLEIRLITAAAISPAVNRLKTPFTFIESQAGGIIGGDGGGAQRVADISADGENIYISAFDSFAFPVLVKIATTLDANGSIVFEPGAGSRIGVQCGNFNEDHLWVCGHFDSTNVIEKSENAGSSFAVKDDGTIGAVRAFQIGPNNDNTLLVVDGENSDILETIDDGATWTTINASVTPEINAMARLDKNPEETVFANQGDATNSINYTVNSGVNLEDLQTGVYPNADATGVIVT